MNPKKNYRTAPKSFFSLVGCAKCSGNLVADKNFQGVCKKCEANLDKNNLNSFRGKFICDICSSSQSECLECNKSFLPEFNHSFNDLIIFFQVKCEKDNSIACCFDPESLQTLCESCAVESPKIKVFSLKEFDLYSFLNSLFVEFYTDTRKKFCPERRKFFFTRSTQELLNVCRWIQNYKNPRCCNHPDKPGQYIGDDFKSRCIKCTPSYYKYNLSSPLVSAELVQDIKEIAKQTPSEYLNKYVLSLFKVKGIQTVKGEELNLLILEARDLISRTQVDLIRCVNCLSKLTAGSKIGLRNPCGHTICFNCSLEDYFNCCSLDRSRLERYVYVPVPYEKLIPYCHGLEFLFNCTLDLYKLPCYHYSCSDCLKYQNCLDCGYSFSLLSTNQKYPKLDNQIREIINFFSMSCDVHNSPIIYFNNFTHNYMCKDCQQDTRSPYNIIKLNYLNNFIMSMNIFENTFTRQLKSISDADIDLDTFKKISFYRIISYNERLKLIKNLRGNSELSVYLLKTIQRFTEYLPNRWTSTKIWEIKEDSITGITIKVAKKISLAGIVLYGRHYPDILITDSLVFAVQTIKVIEISGNISKTILEYSPYVCNDKKENKILFYKSINLNPDDLYQIILKLTPGCYLFGVPYYQIPNRLISISQLKQLSGELKTVGNESIGGTISGFITS